MLNRGIHCQGIHLLPCSERLVRPRGLQTGGAAGRWRWGPALPHFARQAAGGRHGSEDRDGAARCRGAGRTAPEARRLGPAGSWSAIGRRPLQNGGSVGDRRGREGRRRAPWPGTLSAPRHGGRTGGLADASRMHHRLATIVVVSTVVIDGRPSLSQPSSTAAPRRCAHSRVTPRTPRTPCSCASTRPPVL